MPGVSVHGMSMGGMSMHGMSMGGMSMHGMSMHGMAMSGGHVSANLLPPWLAIVWTLGFIAIVASHCRHLLASHGQRRVWHLGHVAIAAGMVVMYAPAALDRPMPSGGFWRLTFGAAAGVTLAWVVAELLNRRATNVLWLMAALDLGAMAYMWSPGGFVAPVSWLLVSYFAAQAVLWGVSAYRRTEGRWQISAGLQLSGGGAVAISAASSEPLICDLELRPSMITMSAGMAYMLLAMQLM